MMRQNIEREQALRDVYETQVELALAWNKMSWPAKLLLFVLHPVDALSIWSYVRLWWLLRRFV